MVAVAPAVENLTLDVTQEIHVRSSMTATFAALLKRGTRGRSYANGPRALAWRPLVP